MAQAYSDPSRAADPHALPDIEVFYVPAYNAQGERPERDEGPAGWYWWSCFPGCLPDGDPCGPFETEAEALADAQGGRTFFERDERLRD
jgi:hypothetical protein